MKDDSLIRIKKLMDEKLRLEAELEKIKKELRELILKLSK
jgi:hypothetical protein